MISGRFRSAGQPSDLEGGPELAENRVRQYPLVR
jgi:hypothetical protein